MVSEAGLAAACPRVVLTLEAMGHATHQNRILLFVCRHPRDRAKKILHTQNMSKAMEFTQLQRIVEVEGTIPFLLPHVTLNFPSINRQDLHLLPHICLIPLNLLLPRQEYQNLRAEHPQGRRSSGKIQTLKGRAELPCPKFLFRKARAKERPRTAVTRVLVMPLLILVRALLLLLLLLLLQWRL